MKLDAFDTFHNAYSHSFYTQKNMSKQNWALF